MCRIHTTTCSHCGHVMAYYKTLCPPARIARQACGQVHHETASISAEGCLNCWQARYRRYSPPQRGRRESRVFLQPSSGGAEPATRASWLTRDSGTCCRIGTALIQSLRRRFGRKRRDFAPPFLHVAQGTLEFKLNPHTWPPSTRYVNAVSSR